MKNKQLIFNAILGLAVIILFVLQFSDNEKPEQDTAPKEAIVIEETPEAEELFSENDSLTIDAIVEDGSALTFPVGYVNMAKLQKEFKYFDKKAQATISKFDTKRKALQTDLQEFEKKYQQLIADVQNGLVTEEEAAALQAQLQPVYMNLNEKSAKLDQEFQQAQANLVQDANAKISSFLEKNSDRLNYSMVIGNSEIGSVVLYHKDSLDITDQMIKGLNKAYK